MSPQVSQNPALRKVVSFSGRHASVIVLVAIVGLMSFIKPIFLRVDNIINVLRAVSIVGTISIGMTFVILTGGIDLSVGAVLGLAGVLVARFAGQGLFTTLLIGLVLGAFFGLFNGVVNYQFRLQSFIVTLSSMSIARGITFLITKGQVILFDKYVEAYTGIAYGYTGPLPTLTVIWLTLTLVAYLVMRFSKYGRYVYAIGGNQEAAFLTGISVGLVRVSAFAICGLTSGLAGFLETAYFSSGIPNAGTGFELDAIASVVIGGTSLSGGKGSIGGTLIGVLLFGVLSNIFNLLNISAYIQMIAKGVLVLLAVYASARTIEQQAVVK